ncbi:MAG: thioredoxin fold domain-containing protein [Candidatus Melainabacteria bacterium]|nr:thioredoxin fold domain-containing protein [Candidatus Melainabacteria bacterium]
MAPTNPESKSNDRSTRVMPQALVLVAALFLVGRITDIGFQLARSSAPQAVQQSIQWHDLPELTMDSNSFKTKQEFVPPPVLDVSPETKQEIDKVLTLSRDQNKYVLYEFYAPWSDPCKKMEATSLANEQVNALVEQHFMPFRVTDRLKQLGKNPRLVTDLQKKYRIFAFPTLVIVDERGETAATLVGNCSSLTTYRFLSRTIHSLEQKSRAQQGTRIGSDPRSTHEISGIVSSTTASSNQTLAVESPKG